MTPSIRMTNFVTDWLQITKHGYRLTDVKKLRTRYVRQYSHLSARIGEGRGSIHAQGWLGNTAHPIAVYHFDNDLVVVNADDMWGRIVSNRLRLDLCRILETLGQDYVVVSQGAMNLARIRPETIKPIASEKMMEKMKTLPEDTPLYYKQRRVWYKASKTGKKPKTRSDGTPFDRWYPPYLRDKKGYAVWEWWEHRIDQIPPAKDGYYHWHKPAAWMQPAAVFSCIVREARRTRWISALDHNDRPPRYFLSQIPDKAKAHTIDAALDALAPPAVHLARKQGRRVVRQGDVFAIKTDLTLKDLLPRKQSQMKMREFYKWQWIDCSSCPHCVITTVSAKPQGEGPFLRPAKWRWNSAFEIATIAATHAQFRGRRVGEQHDHDLIAHYEDVAGRLRVHGTAHSCTEVIHTTDGLVYGKGMMRHEPRLVAEIRERDHQNMLLDDGSDGWWLLVRNTVPPLDPT